MDLPEPAKPCQRHNLNREMLPTHHALRGVAVVAFPNEFITKRLLMRRPTEADAEQMFVRYSHDAEVVRYLSWRPHRSIDDTLEYIGLMLKDSAQGLSTSYLILFRESGELLGSIGGRIQAPLVEFGYCLARDSWGRGYATEAARKFVAVALSQGNICRVQAFCDIENQASARVLEKAGLTFEGILRRYMVMPNVSEKPRDMKCYAQVREQ
jgi:RimJ/RimL family protein N-acetyltransferase